LGPAGKRFHRISLGPARPDQMAGAGAGWMSELAMGELEGHSDRFGSPQK